MKPPFSILLLEDSATDAKLIELTLRRAGIECAMRRVVDEAGFRAALAEAPPVAVLSDYKVPGFRGDAALAVVREFSSGLPFLCVSGTIGEELAVDLMKAGATDYVLKNHLERLPMALRRALDEAEQRTARRVAEEAARQSSETLALALAASNMGTWDWNIATGELEWSDRCKALFGIPTGEPMNYGRFLKALHPADRRRADAAVTRALAEETPYDTEFRIQGRDGSVRWVASSGRAFYDDVSGTPIRMVGTARDITARKEAEAALSESEQRYRSLFDHSLDAIFSLDDEGRFIAANAAAQRLAGHTLEELKTIHFLELCPPDSRDAATKAFRAAFCRQCLTMETAMIAKSGERREIFLSGAPVVVNGEVVGVSCIARDVTARRQAEEALRASEGRFRALGTASSEVLYSMSPDWSEMRHLHGGDFLADTASPNRNWLQEYIHPEDQPHVLAVIDEAIQAGRVFELEHRVRRADGTRGWTFSRAVPLKDANGEIVEWFGAASDVTARKQAEEMLARSHAELDRRVAERTGELHAAVNALEAEIAERHRIEAEVLRILDAERMRVAADLHDGICQELVAIQFLSNLLRRDLERESHPLTSGATRIEDAISGTTSNTREVARGMNPVVADGNGLMHALQQLAETTMQMRGIQCGFECPEPVVIENPTVANELYRIAQEAVHNAVLHGRPKRITVRLSQAGDHARLEVMDDGRGLPADISRGPGMGLRVMKYRASLIGGHLVVQPCPGAGTEVICRIPKPSPTP